MTDIERGLLQALREGALLRARNGRRRLGTWLRRIAPAAVLLRLTVGLAYFAAAELAVPPSWATSAAFAGVAAAAALFAALAPGGVAPLATTGFVIAAWIIASAVDPAHTAGLWLAASVALLLYAGHATAAIAQRFRTTTDVDAEIILTWARHLGIVTIATVSLTVAFALFTSYFAAIPAAVAVGVGIMAALTVIYVLARSLHNPS
ncbi:hypothetical protein [Glycomyces xiaoerkulensis]|uniref:hypothetical protein n=1 Tax=Glycomyces xiaoerkulensis TaxID=2038139 RepID=UPI000C25AC7F|nr:hypothetical protein [Glycomyces xiaoerkulensis]